MVWLVGCTSAHQVPAECEPGASTACTCAVGLGARVCTEDGSYGACVCIASDAGCLPGTSDPCTCATGDHGAAVCGTDGSFGACRCEPTDAGCTPGDVIPCTCADGRAGSQRCGAGGWQACLCPDDPGDACLPDRGEWCGGGDDDCDGLVDEGHVCPDDTIADAVPFDGTVWMLGRNATPTLEEVSPERRTIALDTSYRPDWATLHEGVLHYLAFEMPPVIRRFDPTAPDPALPPLPCTVTYARFGFDGAGRLLVACGAEAYLEGAPLGRLGGELLGVLGSGRLLVTSVEGAALLDRDGVELSRASSADLAGTLYPLGPAVIMGDEAWVTLRRVLHRTSEIVVLHVDAAGAWRIARRVLDPDFTTAVGLPDGRVIAVSIEARAASFEVYERSVAGERTVLLRGSYPGPQMLLAGR